MAKIRKKEAPPEYSEELAARLCSQVATGKALDVACANAHPGLTADIVYLWLFRSPEFVQAYREAKRAAMMKFLEDTIAIADDDSADTYTALTKDGDSYEAPNSAAVKRSDVKIRARQWAMKNLDKDIFGEHRPLKPDGEGNETTIVIKGGLPD